MTLLDGIVEERARTHGAIAELQERLVKLDALEQLAGELLPGSNGGSAGVVVVEPRRPPRKKAEPKAVKPPEPAVGRRVSSSSNPGGRAGCLQALREASEPMTVPQVAAIVGIGDATSGQHLRALVNAGEAVDVGTMPSSKGGRPLRLFAAPAPELDRPVEKLLGSGRAPAQRHNATGPRVEKELDRDDDPEPEPAEPPIGSNGNGVSALGLEVVRCLRNAGPLTAGQVAKNLVRNRHDVGAECLRLLQESRVQAVSGGRYRVVV